MLRQICQLVPVTNLRVQRQNPKSESFYVTHMLDFCKEKVAHWRILNTPDDPRGLPEPSIKLWGILGKDTVHPGSVNGPHPGDTLDELDEVLVFWS